MKNSGLPDKTAERLYKEEQLDFYARMLRVGTRVGMVGYPAYGILDYFVYPELLSTFLVFRLFGLAAITFGFFASNTKWGRRNVFPIATVVYLTATLSIVAMIYLTEGYASGYYVGLMVVLVFLMWLLPMPFRYTAVAVLGTFFSYVAVLVAGPKITEPRLIISALSFFGVFAAILLLSSNMVDQIRVKEFLSRYRLRFANDELKRMDRLKTEFFANVSHEVRTPLASIVGPLESLVVGDVGEVPGDQLILLKQIHRNSNRLLGLINQMLDFSKLESGGVRVRVSHLDLVQYAKDTSELFVGSANKKSLELVVSTTEKELWCWTDADRLERIITNLVRNSIKFTPSGRVTINVSQSEGLVSLKVSDTGVGITPEKIETIFDRFSQVDGTSTREHEGSGLGLAIVSESVEVIHGQITVNSLIDAGTVFTTTFPLDLRDHEPEAEIVAYEPDGGGSQSQIVTKPVQKSPEPVKPVVVTSAEPKKKAGETTAKIMPFVLEPTPEPKQETPSPSAGVESGEKPIKKKSRRDKAPVMAAEIARTGSILVVEDNEDLRTYLAMMLSRWGYQVLQAEDGVIAWDRIQSRDDIILVLSDVMMPRMDGYALLDTIRSSEKHAELPVIIVTAKSGTEAKNDALKNGADDYLSKPVNVRELEDRLMRVLGYSPQ